MLRGFEDAFMEAQSKNVSLCIELLEETNINVDKVYIYMFQNDIQYFYNAFFEGDRKIYYLNDLFSDELIDKFLDCGIDDIENIVQVCKKYEGKCPIEFKLTYNIKTKAFDSKYEYEDFVSEKGDSLVERFEEWINECKNKLVD